MSKPSYGELNKIGIIVFVVSETVFFLALGLAFWIAKNNNPIADFYTLSTADWVLVITALAVLLASSLTFFYAINAAKSNNFKGLNIYLLNTGLLGFIFLLLQVIQTYKWTNIGISISSGIAAAAFYILAAIHAVHILAALIWIFYLYSQARKKRYYSENYAHPERAMIFWQFVVFIWPILFFVIYF